MKSFIALACLVASAGCFLFGKKVEPDWDELSVTFPKYSGLPKTESDAKSNGWVENADGCKSGAFKGKRYLKDGNTASMLLFDHNGNVAGYQMAVPDTSKIATFWTKAHIHENGLYIMTSYFTDPDTICSGQRATTDGYVGDNLYLVLNNGPVKIPLNEVNVLSTMWTKGKCFVGMGQHYWYNIRKDMDCNEFAPFFLLYNGGKLNGYGFATFGNLKNDRVENPPQSAIKLFFQQKPVCIEKQPYLTTQHVYLQRRPYLNFC